MAEKTVDGYISGLAGWQVDVAVRLRRIILDAAPEAKESFKWAQPVYEINGPFCYLKAFKDSVNFGFWRGVDLHDPKGLLRGTGEKMRNVKIENLEDMDEGMFADFVRQAVQLNLSKGDPTKGG
jgi:hypothetical protein